MLKSQHCQTAWISKELSYIPGSDIFEDADSCNWMVQDMGRTKSEVAGPTPQLGRS
jgi:hypothetical protein